LLVDNLIAAEENGGVRLSEEESTFLIWFQTRLNSLHAAGDPRTRITLEEYRSKLPFSEERSFEVAADLVDKGLLTATHQSFHYDLFPSFVDGEWRGGGGGYDWWELGLTEAGKAQVKRLRRWWRRLFRALGPGSRGE
jgi:hypothetical protein